MEHPRIFAILLLRANTIEKRGQRT